MARASRRTPLIQSKSLCASSGSRGRASLKKTTNDKKNDLRVFAARSRCKNSVGLNAVGVEGSASAYGIFSGDWCVEGGVGEQVEASGRRLRRHCGLREGRRAADRLRFAVGSREIGCAGPNVFVACPRHAGTTWCLSQETGFASHGPWARFGESWRTNIRGQGATKPLKWPPQTSL